MEVNIYFTYFFIYVEPNLISRKPTHLLPGGSGVLYGGSEIYFSIFFPILERYVYRPDLLNKPID